MKAAIVETLGQPLRIAEMSAPEIGTGEVVVDVVAAPVLSYANEVFNGKRRYMIDLPMVPGCGAIGRVRTIGPDATHLKPGDWVFCDPTVRSRDDALMPDITLQGWSARGEGGMRLQQHFHDGTFAEQVRVPTENAIRIGEIDPGDAARWCALDTMPVPYGGLLAAQFQAGETLLVSDATGDGPRQPAEDGGNDGNLPGIDEASRGRRLNVHVFVDSRIRSWLSPAACVRAAPPPRAKHRARGRLQLQAMQYRFGPSGL
jgi:alcohol dehydrogenase